MVKYILKCARRMNFSSFAQTIKKVSKETKRSSLSIMADMIYCGFKYGTGFNDYYLCDFANLSKDRRESYITRGANQTLSAKLNDSNYHICFNDKKIQYRVFNSALGRVWIDTDESSLGEIKEFLSDKKEIIIKPSGGTGGFGIEKLKRDDFASLDEMVNYVRESKTDIAEEVIYQHSELDGMNKSSVNTVRVVTVIAKGEVNVMYAFLRMGNGERPVDNLHSGGLFAPIDLETGVISAPGYDKEKKTHINHPLSQKTIEGFQIPCWEEVLQTCKKVATFIPMMKYIGWDIAVTRDNEAVLIEGNHLPGYDILQMPPHIKGGLGLLPEFKKLLSDD